MEHNILQFLHQLSAVQERTLSVLSRKQSLLVKPNQEGLLKIAAEEQEVLAQLKQCLARREEILATARHQGHAAESIQVLCRRILPPRSECQRLVEEAARRSRMIQSQCVTNWVMTQKSLIHLSQMLEIVETRGQGKPTYHRQGEKESGSPGGFIDRAA